MRRSSLAFAMIEEGKMTENERIRALRVELVDWLGEMLHTSGAKGFVFGMSGGVDSNVTALLAKEAAGENHLGLIMPIDNDPQEKANAERLAKEHNIKIQNVEMSAAFDNLLEILPSSDDLTRTNFKSRLRMSVLYYYANILQYLVIGTINKAEFTIGYFAKYGSYGDILPLTSLLKRDIRSLALELRMAQDLATQKASGCVTGSQNAEDEWGISEEDLDEIVANWDNSSVLVDGLLSQRLKQMYKSAEHKRHYPPIFIPSTSNSNKRKK